MVAMTPLITIQILGVVYKLRAKSMEEEFVPVSYLDSLDDDAIIEL